MITQLRKTRLHRFLAIVMLFLFSVTFAQEPLSLDALIKEARQNNPDILAAKKRWEASKTRIPQAKSLDNPSVSFEFMKIPRGTFKLDRTMSEDRMLSISQMFPLFGKLSLKGKIALIESQMFAADYKNKELEVINAVKNSYYDLFMNYKEIELKEESLKFLENIAQVAERKYVVGDIMQEDVFKINLEIAKLSNDIVNLYEGKKAKETRINAILNRGPENPLGHPQLKEDAFFDTSISLSVNGERPSTSLRTALSERSESNGRSRTIDKGIESLYRLTLENQPELLIFSYAIEKNRYAKSLAKRSFFPDLMAEIGLRGLTGGGIGPWDLMLAFTVPFWFWTKQRYEVKEAIVNLEEAEAAYQTMKNKALSETKDLFTKIEIAKNKIKLYKTNLIPILKGSIESSLAAFRSGKGDFMMLLDTERMLIEAEMDYYKALVEYNMNLADLERTVGMDLR